MIYFILFNCFLYTSYIYTKQIMKSKITKNNYSYNGFQIAKRITNHLNLNTIRIKKGKKSFYDWHKKTVFLDSFTYEENNSSSYALSAHECSHAYQHKIITPLSIFRIIFLFLKSISLVFLLIIAFKTIINGVIIYKTFIILLSFFVFLYYFICTFHEIEANHFALSFLNQLEKFNKCETNQIKHIYKTSLLSYLTNTISTFSLFLHTLTL